MPRRRTPEPEVVIPTTSLVASAARYPGKSDTSIYQPRQQWQRECYRHYSICGEARFAARFFGHAVSRATLYAGTIEDGERVPQKEGPLADIFNSLFHGADGQSQMLDAIGIHLTIAGECYLVGRTIKGTEQWEIVSCLEMDVTGKEWQIKYAENVPPVTLTEKDVVIRIWTPHPERRLEADSPFRSLLPILAEIEWLTRHVFSQITSRLAGAGVFFVPDTMTFPPPPEIDGKAQVYANAADGFMRVLADAMLTPLGEPGSPAATIPIVVTAPADAIDKAKLLHFWSDLDAESKALRQEAIGRFALGMDLPPEQVLGMGSNSGSGGGRSNGVSHWGAWQIEEATIKLHIEPMLDVIVNSLTIGFLRPLTDEDDQFTDQIVVVIYDSSPLRLRPDRSKESLELYDRGLISARAVVRENGFDIDDIPTPEEFQRWLLIKIASGSATPEQVQAAANALGADLGPLALPDAPVREARPDPSIEDHPTNPRTPEAALIAACEGLVFRALERAGNRMRSLGSRPPNVPAYEAHVYVKANGKTKTFLDDAWSCAPQVLAGLADTEKVVPVLDAYCTNLMNEQSPHTRERLSDWLVLADLT
jgi:hypothetical protein